MQAERGHLKLYLMRVDSCQSQHVVCHMRQLVGMFIDKIHVLVALVLGQRLVGADQICPTQYTIQLIVDIVTQFPETRISISLYVPSCPVRPAI